MHQLRGLEIYTSPYENMHTHKNMHTCKIIIKKKQIVEITLQQNQKYLD